MKKRDWSILAGLCGVLVVVLVAGEVHARAQKQQQYQAYLSYKSRGTNSNIQPASTGTSDQVTGTPTTSVAGGVSTLDYLGAIAKQKGAPRLVVIGSSGTKGVGVTDPKQDWYSLFITQLKVVPGLESIKSYNLGVYGATTSSLLNETTLSQVVSDRPNVILLETCALTDWYQNIPEKTSVSNLKEIVSQLQTALPETRIVLYSPNPTQDSPNKTGHTYADYLNSERALIQVEGWDFVDVHASMAAAVGTGIYTLNQLLADAYHPNAQGYKLWEQAIWSGLKHDHGGKTQSAG